MIISVKTLEMEVLASCEQEIQEVMKQIDILVSSKQQEWEIKHESISKNLEKKENEIRSQQSLITYLKTEITNMKTQNMNQEKNRMESETRYKSEIKNLKQMVQVLQNGNQETENALHLNYTLEEQMIALKIELKDSLLKLQEYAHLYAQEKQKNEHLTVSFEETLEREKLKLAETCQHETLEWKSREETLVEQIEILQQKNQELESALISQKKEAQSLKLDFKDVLEQLKLAFDQIEALKNASQTKHLPLENHQKSSLPLIPLDSHRLETAAFFLEEERKYAGELESILDTHIHLLESQLIPPTSQ